MTSQEIQSAVQEVENGQAILIDVRRTEEWVAGHAKQAVHFDSDKIFTLGELPDVANDQKIYLYCRSGGRAGRVKLVMKNFGFTNVHNLGGLSDWYRAGGK